MSESTSLYRRCWWTPPELGRVAGRCDYLAAHRGEGGSGCRVVGGVGAVAQTVGAAVGVPLRRPARCDCRTGLPHQVGLIRSLSAAGVTRHRCAAR